MKGIVIIGYGSNEPDSAEVVRMQAGRIKDTRTYPVYWAYTRVNSPSVDETLSQMAEDGIDEAVVIPLVISEGMVTTKMIPDLLGITYPEGEVTVDGHKIRLRMARAVGTDPRIAEYIAEAVEKNNAKKDTPILVIGHGSKDMKNPEIVSALAESLKKAGYSDVTACFNEFNDPTVEDAFASALSKADDLVIAVPFFIAGGVHVTRDIPPKIGLPERGTVGCVDHDGKKIMVVLTQPIGLYPCLRNIIIDRADEILGKDRRPAGD